MRESNQHIQMTFNCQENLGSMSDTEKGKFCSSCKREVIDFTKMSYSEIQAIRSVESDMCGTFLTEQIQPELRPIEAPRVRYLAFLSTVLLSLNFGSVSAQSTVDPKVEQSQGASNAPNLTPEEATKKSESGQHISMSKAAAPVTETQYSEIEKKKSERYKKMYWSKRFPFLHRKRRYVSGRFL